jgi:HSP20 family protein
MITVSIRPGQIRSHYVRDKQNYSMVNWRISGQPYLWQPPTDLLELEDRFIVRIEIAGMNEEDFSVTLENNILTVQGNRPDISGRLAYHQMEVNFGEFLTIVEIPEPIQPEIVFAEYQNGFLWITFPKAKSKHIHITE